VRVGLRLRQLTGTAESGSDRPRPADERPWDATEVHTEQLPDTPRRDANIPATAWLEAPAALRELGRDLPGAPTAAYKRRIGHWLLWRAGPARHAEARYLAVDADDLERTAMFSLNADGTGEGADPAGRPHARFRTWKEALLSESRGRGGRPPHQQ
jgi:hypothetical protein